jgi:phage shock protein C
MNETAVNSPSGTTTHTPRPLSRPTGDRMLGGVAMGIARYLDVDVTVVRIVFAVLAMIGGAGVPIYVAGWLLIPEEGSEQSIASQFTRSR